MMRGGGGGAFPVVEERQTSTGPSDTSHTATVSAGGAVAGELLIAVLTIDNTNAFDGWPVDWNFAGDINSGASTITIGYKIADGGETSVVVTSNVAGISVHRVWRISGAGDTPDITTGAFNVGTSTSPNPQSVSPSWGAKKTLWIAIEWHLSATVDVYPSDYSNGVDVVNSTLHLGAAEREREIATEDPGVFTLSASVTWGAGTMAVEPS